MLIITLQALNGDITNEQYFDALEAMYGRKSADVRELPKVVNACCKQLIKIVSSFQSWLLLRMYLHHRHAAHYKVLEPAQMQESNLMNIGMVRKYTKQALAMSNPCRLFMFISNFSDTDNKMSLMARHRRLWGPMEGVGQTNAFSLDVPSKRLERE
ncbi:hypothetical protein GJ496_011007 [Pomphorhynchus laevis]|nr:hypothetical protein GJ496_011007 [Pomphorhynchus laevis]